MCIIAMLMVAFMQPDNLSWFGYSLVKNSAVQYGWRDFNWSLVGIRANGDEGYQKPRLFLKDGNYRYWITVIEQVLREKKVWGHVQGTVVTALKGKSVIALDKHLHSHKHLMKIGKVLMKR